MVEISSDIIRGYNDIMILKILMDGSSYGYEIQKKIKELTDGKYVIKETTLYSAFARLEKAGYVSSTVKNLEGEKKRTYYDMTALGKEYYTMKCEEWELTREVIGKFVKEISRA